MNRLFLSALGMGTILAASACNSNESTKEGDEHDPVRVVLSVNGTAMTGDTLFLPVGMTEVIVRGTFYNSADESLDDVETEHFSKLTFDPTTLATATIDAAHHYTHSVDVQGAANATGTVSIGFGHDALADEHTLTAPVRITP
jgi:hypothetical protein